MRHSAFSVTRYALSSPGKFQHLPPFAHAKVLYRFTDTGHDGIVRHDLQLRRFRRERSAMQLRRRGSVPCQESCVGNEPRAGRDTSIGNTRSKGAEEDEIQILSYQRGPARAQGRSGESRERQQKVKRCRQGGHKGKKEGEAEAEVVITACRMASVDPSSRTVSISSPCSIASSSSSSSSCSSSSYSSVPSSSPSSSSSHCGDNENDLVKAWVYIGSHNFSSAAWGDRLSAPKNIELGN